MILSQWIDEIKTINLRYISFYESYTHPSFSRFRKTLQIFIDITMKYFGSAPNKIWIVAELKLRDVNNSCCWQEQKMMMRARTLALEIWELRSNEFKWLWKVGGNEKSCYLCWTISSTRHQSVILSKIHYKSDCWGKKSPLAGRILDKLIDPLVLVWNHSKHFYTHCNLAALAILSKQSSS